MDFLNGKIKSMYFKYLSAAFGSAMITSIYSIVDMAMVGQYQGPSGTAALAVVAPVWNIIYSLGLLMGIGGSVIFSTKRGRENEGAGDENQYFTVAVMGSVVLSLAAWVIVVAGDEPILRFFGADETLLPLAQEYMLPIKFVFPLFLFNQMLAAFLRNDKNPGLATLGVLSGGIFNIFGDYVFVFTFNMGIYGAGLATAIGSAISFVVMLTHFFSRKNSLALERPTAVLKKFREISVTGFSTFFIDVAMGILTVLFNRQIMEYLGANALAIYGPIINVSTFVQCLQCGAGGAADHLHKLRCRQWKSNQTNSSVRTLYYGIFWSLLDCLELCLSESVYSDLYGTDCRNIGYGSGHHPMLWVVVPAAAFEYFLNLLFSGHTQTKSGLCRICVQGPCHQRHIDFTSAGYSRS